jgi:hypothetical protein
MYRHWTIVIRFALRFPLAVGTVDQRLVTVVLRRRVAGVLGFRYAAQARVDAVRAVHDAPRHAARVWAWTPFRIAVGLVPNTVVRN